MRIDLRDEARVFKDERGVYKISTLNKQLNKETNEEEEFFVKIPIHFRKGVELKNKTKINIKEGFLKFYRVDTGDVYEDGNPIYINFPRGVILDFDVIEEGVDEVQQTRDYSKKSTKPVSTTEIMDAYYPDTSDLPF